MSINQIVNDLVILSPSELASSIVRVIVDLLQTMSFIWSFLSYNFIDFDFTILGIVIDIEINGFYMFTIGGLILFIILKAYALIPLLPD